MNKIHTPFLVAATATLMFATPAFANTQADLKTCRAALTEQGHFDNNLHSLKFSHRKGNTRKRTMFLTRKDRSDNSKYTIQCKLHRKDVIDLNITPK